MATSNKPKNETDSASRWAFNWILVLIPAGLASLWVLSGTRWGPWTYTDGVGYLASARNLVDGPGLGLVSPSGQFELLVSHPPVYPLALASLYASGIDLIQSARWINIAAFFLFVGATTALFQILTDQWRASLSLGLLLAISPAIAILFLGVLAEPLFLLFGFCGLLLFSLYLQRGQARLFWLSSFSMLMASLTRYPGIAFSLTAAALLLGEGNLTIRVRLRQIALLLGPQVLAIGAFLLWARGQVTGGAARGMRFPTTPLSSTWAYLRQLANVIWNWKPIPAGTAVNQVLGGSWTRSLPLLLALAILGSAMWWAMIQLRYKDQPLGSSTRFSRQPLARVMGTFLVIYSLFFFAAYVLTNPTPDVDQRTMIPMLVAGEIALIEMGRRMLSRTIKASAASFAATVLYLSIMVGFGISAFDIVSGMHRTGAGYTAEAWQLEETVALLDEVPANRILVSNAPEAVLLYKNRYPHDLRSLALDASVDSNDCFGKGDHPLEDAYRQGRVAFVLFDPDMPGVRNPQAPNALCEPLVLVSTASGQIITHSQP